MNKRWFLFNPPTGRYIRDTRCQASVDDIVAVAERPPVDLAYIAGAISCNGDECMIKDYPAERQDIKRLEEDLKSIKPDYVVINTTMFTFQEDLKICSLVKGIHKDAVTIAKGAVFFQESVEVMKEFPELDIGVSGEEEQTFEQLSGQEELLHINNITYRRDGEIIRNPCRIYPQLRLRKPRIELINHDLYRRPDTKERQATIVVGRGCPGRCIYCIAPMVGGSVARYRDVEEVLEEIREYYCKYNISNFYFGADTFTWDEKWVTQLCSGIRKLPFKIAWLCNSRIDRITDPLVRMMREAGCWGMSIGIESGNERIQKLIKKGLRKQQIINALHICRKHHIVCLLHFIIGFPWDNRATVKETIRFAKKLKGNIVEFYIATPLRGTELYDILLKEKLIKPRTSELGLNYVTATADTLYLSSKDLTRLREKAIRRIYLDPFFYIRSLRHMKSPKQLYHCAGFMLGKAANMIKRMKSNQGRRGRKKKAYEEGRGPDGG